MAPQRAGSYIALITILADPASADDQAKMAHIQQLRKANDRAAARWAPHITLVPPFDVNFNSTASNPPRRTEGVASSSPAPPPYTSLHLPSALGPGKPSYRLSESFRSRHPDGLCEALSQLEANVEAAVNALSPPEDIVLDDIGFFPLSAYDTIHLRPSKTTAPQRNSTTSGRTTVWSLQALIEDTVEQSGARPTLSKRKRKQHHNFSPHLTLGQCNGEESRTALLASANAIIQNSPFRSKADRLQLLFKPKERSGPYHVWREFQVGRPES
ncbi:hypothetical protein OC846_003066 [Tilletia horrida]|uniref:Uncharacterized protein n=1 Tax=Tilletia horrida TaxID=155126 RepID=A0AAN6GQC3_9BASI|nr:hypothetical protein OC845_002819 [Tilletia horrida]KAK0551982.1 hypothetical protein OC846_003066 [Tilletia horrida]KAK0566173.1 hypothetical protein OC861_003394 [Tilletia horrida]